VARDVSIKCNRAECNAIMHETKVANSSCPHSKIAELLAFFKVLDGTH
jgi:hypothetical protein